MNRIRRTLLRGAVSSATLSVAVAAGLLRPGPAVAANNARLPGARSGLQDTLREMYGANPTATDAVQIKLPDIAEDGANVFIEFSSSLPDVDTFVVLVENNPQRLIGAFRLGPEVLPVLQTRIKVARTSRVWVIARSAGQFYKAIKEVKVSVGGCGVGVN